MTAIRLIGDHHTSHRRHTVLQSAMKQRHVTARTSSRLSMRAISSPTVSPNGSASRPHSRMIPCPKIHNRTGMIDIKGYLLSCRASPGSGTEARPD
jgi:hypothetical protein